MTSGIAPRGNATFFTRVGLAQKGERSFVDTVTEPLPWEHGGQKGLRYSVVH